jgi:hypothetical protein
VVKAQSPLSKLKIGALVYVSDTALSFERHMASWLHHGQLLSFAWEKYGADDAFVLPDLPANNYITMGDSAMAVEHFGQDILSTYSYFISNVRYISFGEEVFTKDSLPERSRLGMLVCTYNLYYVNSQGENARQGWFVENNLGIELEEKADGGVRVRYFEFAEFGTAHTLVDWENPEGGKIYTCTIHVYHDSQPLLPHIWYEFPSS